MFGSKLTLTVWTNEVTGAVDAFNARAQDCLCRAKSAEAGTWCSLHVLTGFMGLGLFMLSHYFTLTLAMQ